MLNCLRYMHLEASSSPWSAKIDIKSEFRANGWHVDDEFQRIEPAEVTQDAKWVDANSSLSLIPVADKYILTLFGQPACIIDENLRSVSLVEISTAFAEVDLFHFLLDQVLPRLVAHDKQLVLHAGAVRVLEQSIAFLGESGLGKSTLVASFAQDGFSVLSDDALLVGLNGKTPNLKALYPSLRLFPDSIAAVYPTGSETVAMATYSSKRRLSVHSSTDSGAYAIGMLIFLESDSANEEIEFNRVSSAQACIRLIENSFALDPTNKTHAAARLKKAGILANAVPAFSLFYPRQYDRLPEVRQMIFQTLDNIRTAEQSEQWFVSNS